MRAPLLIAGAILGAIFLFASVYTLPETEPAYLDLSPASANQKEIRASAEDELLAVYALVNTLVQNVPEVRQVRFLVDGREVQTLAGHIDLSHSFGKRADLVKTE